jgi:predicted dehydrogenase
VGHYYWTVPLVKWIALREQGGGQIVDQAIHLIDTIRFVTEDDVEKLYAIYTEKGRNTKEDKALGFDNWTSYIVCLKFKKSAIGAIYSTYALYPRIFEAEREKAEAILDSQVSMDIICRDMLIRCIPAHETRIYRKNRETETYRSSGKPEVKMYRNFIEAILTRDKSLIRTPYEDSYKTMAISLAANESAMTGKIINLEEYVAC